MNHIKNALNPTWKMPDGSIRMQLHHKDFDKVHYTHFDEADLDKVMSIEGEVPYWTVYFDRGTPMAKAVVGKDNTGYYLHRVIAGETGRAKVKHEDNDKLNNRRSNIVGLKESLWGVRAIARVHRPTNTIEIELSVHENAYESMSAKELMHRVNRTVHSALGKQVSKELARLNAENNA